MRVFINLLFLTFVLASTQSVAAPEVSGQIIPSTMDASPLVGPVWPRDQSPYTFSVYSGYAGGNFFDSDKVLSTSVLGFRFSLDSDSDHSWDYNFEVNTPSNLIGIALGRRYFIFTTTDLAPYYKLAAGTHLKASNVFVNFIEIKRWQFRASAGMANLFNLNNHLYTEAGIGIAVIGFEYFAVLGLNFNF